MQNKLALLHFSIGLHHETKARFPAVRTQRKQRKVLRNERNTRNVRKKRPMT